MLSLAVKHNTVGTEEEPKSKIATQSGDWMYVLRGTLPGIEDAMLPVPGKRVTFFLFLTDELPEKMESLPWDILSMDDIGNILTIEVHTDTNKIKFAVDYREGDADDHGKVPVYKHLQLIEAEAIKKS